jgi:hypothetical protein
LRATLDWIRIFGSTSILSSLHLSFLIYKMEGCY